MKIKVCDALCGAGKTVSCINMMNSDIDRKYIFITPYLDEVERIKSSCSGRGFVTPEKNYSSQFSKIKDVPQLLRAGRNIVSTHALFSNYTDEIKELVRENGYVLILDEVIDLFQAVDTDAGDIDFLKRNNTVTEEGDNIVWNDEHYSGSYFKDIMRLAKSREMVDYDGSFYFWSIPLDLFQCFSDVYVLTYLFEYQPLKYFFEANSVEYELIGTTKKNGTYQFCSIDDMDRRRDLTKKIHILQNDKYNEIGNDSYSLSAGWFERAVAEEGQPKLAVLKNNLYNIFRHRGVGATEKLWTTLNRFKGYLKGKGYANNFLRFNARASNDYVHKKHLAYCVNIYMMPWIKSYLSRIGAKDVNQDMYALSMLIQWIFRSAVRNGEEVWIYIPSLRMRYLLQQWITNLSEGKDLEPIKFSKRKIDVVRAAAHRQRAVKKNKGGERDENLQ